MRTLTALVLLSTVCLIGCDGTQHADYATAADAVREGAVARGWLPEVISANVSDIHESHDIDSNRGIADFRHTPDLIPRLERE